MHLVVEELVVVVQQLQRVLRPSWGGQSEERGGTDTWRVAVDSCPCNIRRSSRKKLTSIAQGPAPPPSGYLRMNNTDYLRNPHTGRDPCMYRAPALGALGAAAYIERFTPGSTAASYFRK